MTISGLLPPTEHYPPFTDTIASGEVELITAYGFRANVANVVNGVDIWSGAANTLPIPPLAGEQMSLVSSSAQDGVGGTGIRTMAIHYIDNNGNEQHESITMAGLAAVNTIATNIRFVNDLHALTTGTNAAAVGTITMYSTATPANIYTQIIPGQTRHLNTARMIPNGKTCLIEWFSVSPATAGGGDVRIRATEHHGHVILPTPPIGIFNSEDNIGLYQSGVFHLYPTPIPIPALSIVKCTAFNTTGTPNVQASWAGKIVSAPI